VLAKSGNRVRGQGDGGVGGENGEGGLREGSRGGRRAVRGVVPGREGFRGGGERNEALSTAGEDSWMAGVIRVGEPKNGRSEEGGGLTLWRRQGISVRTGRVGRALGSGSIDAAMRREVRGQGCLDHSLAVTDRGEWGGGGRG